MNKEIIINKVDISGCYFLNKGITNLLCTCPSEIDEECKYNPNCYFKQLQRKTAECERLEAKLNKYEKAGGALDEGEAWYGLAQRYEQALNEIELSIINITSSCNKCEDNKNGYCIGIDECSSRCFKKLLDIIIKVKRGNN
jgi:hypothetical protein